ncbi:hypothetical protein [Fluviicola taffensis]|uniref:Carboxypeptidase regulatory-like domain-containing protein n=1 Tax=Fluviicola taffensis (strain DSM 16823 / NCIMB 13979 / RW262) TaxID=755732 RepID=F2ICR2_FLUTR|nr:hypothetical protein [Fluviicola taffensis]AEA42289.1 hypothetical protein Fluta_0280 [Fluviicola taffensis DSM 16823]
MNKPIMSLPCNQSHTKMEKRDGGYYCSNCEKVLTDFRHKSPTEIKQIITSSPKKVCGVFNNDQISSKTSHVALSNASYRVGLSLLGILGFLGPVITSCESAKDDAAFVKQKAFNKLKFPMTISGQLKDEKTGKPLAKSPVEIQQDGKTILKGYTDESGNFELVVNRKDLKSETFELIYLAKSHLADTLKKQQLSSFKKGQKLILTLKAEATKCNVTRGEVPIAVPGEMIVEGEIAPDYYDPPTAGIPVMEVEPTSNLTIEKPKEINPK